MSLWALLPGATTASIFLTRPGKMKAEFGLVATDINAACSEAVVIHDIHCIQKADQSIQ